MGKQNLGVFSPEQHIDDPILVTGVQGAFFGSALPPAQIEALIAAHVPRAHIKDVAEVYGTKWWDYRRLAPGHSFYLFAHHYYRVSKFVARKFTSEKPLAKFDKDGRKSASIVGASLVQMEVSDIWSRDRGHITGIWNAMLIADAFGIPYPEFVRLACQIALDRSWKRLPLPAQLYAESLAPYVIDEWEKMKDERLFSASHPMYAIDNYAGLSVQDEYREWVIDRIKAQSSQLNAVMTAVYVNRHIPESMALQHFPSQLVTRARLLAA